MVSRKGPFQKTNNGLILNMLRKEMSKVSRFPLLNRTQTKDRKSKEQHTRNVLTLLTLLTSNPKQEDL
jgi:hypothetical protein